MWDGTEPEVLALAEALKRTDRRIVFAESCTGGLVSAALVTVPGISAYHCGSAVVYRYDTKTQWLGVRSELLVDPGPVSAEVAEAMARGVLANTPEADVAVSITGDLGPNAPTETDGVVCVGWAVEGGAESERIELGAETRLNRRDEAVQRVLERAHAVVASLGQRNNKPSEGNSTA